MTAIQVSRVSRPYMRILLTIIILAGLAWTAREIYLSVELTHGADYKYTVAFVSVFLFVGWQLLLSWRSKASTTTEAQQQELDVKRVTLNVPCYNEDPELLNRCIASLFAQTRPVNRIQVVDDGSDVDYTEIRDYWMARVPGEMEFSWVRQPNGGKRVAQLTTFVGDDAEVFITIDSDTILLPNAVEEGLKPFADPRVMSVAALVLTLNKHVNLLTKILDLVVVGWQLSSRSGLSLVGSVMVNSGPYALYRSEVILDNEDAYRNETFGGTPVHHADDSMLTHFALLKGRAVQQESAIALTAWPEKWSHHYRQQKRWARGMWIRSMWRFRYLPFRSYVFWVELIGWAQFILTTWITVDVFFIWNESTAWMIWPALYMPPLMAYVLALRTLMLKRSDETLWQQLGVFLLSPLTIVWGWLVFRPLRVWGIFTASKGGWGTREKVEVSA